MFWFTTMNFQKNLKPDLKKMQSSRNLLVFADKAANLYELSPDQYNCLKTTSLKYTEKPNLLPKPELIKKQESSQSLSN